MKGSVFCEVGNNFGMIGLSEYNAFDEIVAKVNLQLTDQYPNATGSLYRVARRNKKLLLSSMQKRVFAFSLGMKAQEMRNICAFGVTATS